MIERTGNLWDHPAEYKAVTTNGVVLKNGRLVMGAGVAKQARDRFKDLDLILGGHVSRFGSRVFLVPVYRVLSFPTKHDWRADSDPALIEQSAAQLVDVVNKYKIKTVAMTRPGCGNGNLDWVNVKPVLEKYLDDRFTVLSPV